MTTEQIVILIAVLAVIAAHVARRGPRVTQIDREIRKDRDANDD